MPPHAVHACQAELLAPHKNLQQFYVFSYLTKILQSQIRTLFNKKNIASNTETMLLTKNSP